jgi:hypothetical protein
MSIRYLPDGVRRFQLSSAAVRAIKAVIPKKRAGPHSGNPQAYMRHRIGDYVDRCINAASVDLNSGEAEFEHMRIHDCVLERIWMRAPRALGCVKTDPEMTALAGILADRATVEAERVALKPENSALTEQRILSFKRHFVLDPYLEKADLSHRELAQIAGVSLTSIRDYLSGRSRLNSANEQAVIGALLLRIPRFSLTALP